MTDPLRPQRRDDPPADVQFTGAVMARVRANRAAHRASVIPRAAFAVVGVLLAIMALIPFDQHLPGLPQLDVALLVDTGLTCALAAGAFLLLTRRAA